MAAGKDWSKSVVEVAGTKLHLARAGSGRPVWCCTTISARPTGCRFTTRWRAVSTCSCRTIRVTASRSGRNGCATCATSPSSISGCSPISGSSAPRCRARLWRLDRRRDGDDGAARLPPLGSGRRDGGEAARRRHFRPGDRQLYRLRPRRLPRPGGVRAGLWRCLDRPAGRLGSVPRDELPDRLEAVHVHPEPAAFVGRGAGAGAGRLGRRRQDRAAQRRRALRRPAPKARFEIVRASGHCVEMEQPDQLARLVQTSSRRIKKPPGRSRPRRKPCM